MRMRRLIQTTLAHPLQADFSIAAVFAGAALSGTSDPEELISDLGIEAISGGDISDGELRRVLAYTLLERFDVFDMEERAFRSYVNEIGIDIDFLEQAVHGDCFVVERGGLATQALSATLREALGAALGLYAIPERLRQHDVTGSAQVELLSIVTSYGILTCGSQRGLDRALRLGLFEGLRRSFKG